jgi:hypothetical protein
MEVNIMKVQELKVGDRFTQEKGGEEVRFEVLAIESIGRYCRVLFDSPLGRDSACYSANAYLPGLRLESMAVA